MSQIIAVTKVHRHAVSASERELELPRSDVDLGAFPARSRLLDLGHDEAVVQLEPLGQPAAVALLAGEDVLEAEQDQRGCPRACLGVRLGV
jgi:hypothetical protein